ncbi:3935_t:CDS:2 [Ambispora gerdemannii]|uniref:3935_t:CDS:1 n=1 Tax=Ambispora gerdemannii TaxID=144530 RepID=A0A9N8YZH7_9GLOM|nr:3935_t:CDS:2 [Ambispora gerdemannii]
MSKLFTTVNAKSREEVSQQVPLRLKGREIKDVEVGGVSGGDVG